MTRAVSFSPARGHRDMAWPGDSRKNAPPCRRETISTARCTRGKAFPSYSRNCAQSCSIRLFNFITGAVQSTCK